MPLAAFDHPNDTRKANQPPIPITTVAGIYYALSRLQLEVPEATKYVENAMKGIRKLNSESSELVAKFIEMDDAARVRPPRPGSWTC